MENQRKEFFIPIDLLQNSEFVDFQDYFELNLGLIIEMSSDITSHLQIGLNRSQEVGFGQ